MSKLLKSKIFLGLMIVAFMFVASVAVTHAATTLKFGSRGTAVTDLQTKLNVTPATGYFGKLTKAAVMAFQKDNGLKVDGIAGPATMAAIDAAGTTTTTTTTTTSSTCPTGYVATTPVAPTFAACVLAPATTTEALCPNGMTLASNCLTAPIAGTTGGTAGTLTNVNSISGYSGITVNAGDKGDKVLGAQFLATGSDMKIGRLTVDFKRDTSVGYYNLSQYISNVAVWNGSTQIATLPVSAASDLTSTSPDTYEFTFSGLNYTVPAGTAGQIYVTVDINTTVDSENASGKTWQVSIPAGGLRATDLAGEEDFYSTNAINTFTVQNLSASGNVQLRAALDASSPAAAGVQVNSVSGQTSGVKLLAVDMYAKTGSPITVRKFPVTLTVNTASGSGFVTSVVNNLTLTNGTQTYTANVPTTTSTGAASVCATAKTCTVLFGSDSGVLGWTIPAGTTQTWTVSANISPIAGYFAEGDSVVASVDTLYNTALNEGLDAQDSLGNPINLPSALSGSALGNAMAFYVNGITVTSGSQTMPVANALNSATHQTGQFTLTFNAGALNQNVYLPLATDWSGTAGTAGKVYAELYDTTAQAVVTGVTGTLSSSTTATGDATNGLYTTTAGRTFSLQVSYTPTSTTGTGAAGHYLRLQLVGINYTINTPTGNTVSFGSNLGNYTANLNNIYTPSISLN